MALTNAYCTLADLKAYLGITDIQSADTTNLEDAIQAASRWVDSYCRRPPASFAVPTAATVRYFQATDAFYVTIDDLANTTDLAIEIDVAGDGTYEYALATTDYQLLPENAADDGVPFDSIAAVGGYTFPPHYVGTLARRGRVKVTGRWGWPAVPDVVKYATLIEASRLFHRKDSPQGVAGFGEFGAVRNSRSDADVESLLAEYRLVSIHAG